ncbi:MAG TPA: efflux RND transporter periplasmic adaptor subunit [Planctomicrobium sp.]|nr:efflux RND transporter periplasmic adaptor subunit [Planctomicrobium sp.]
MASAPNSRWKHRLVLGLASVVGFGGLLLLRLMTTNAAQPEIASGSQFELDGTNSEYAASAIRVTAISPQVGGVVRSTRLPCSAHWHDSADLFAKVSGYLDKLNVDIGSRVKVGDVLAMIDVPELEEDVILAEAALNYQLAAVAQFEARKKSAIAQHRAAEAACIKAEADVERWNAEILFREKELHRLKALSASNSVQEALVDEKLFQLQSTQAAKRSAETVILTSKEEAAAAGARVELADADIAVARMQTRIEEARLKKARLYASFARIVSPYEGVITTRQYHPGEFIRSADKASGEPLLTVGRTDLVRVVVHIPDRDVPYANPGDPVDIMFDTLPGHQFTGELARIACSEDIRTRTMRAEVDLPNDQNLLVDQMYGQMTIQLQAASETLTLPSVCLVGDLKNGNGSVFIAEEGIARLRSISVGLHDGVRVEVIEGLTPKDLIVVRPPAGLSDGSAISVDVEATKG